MLRNRKGFTLIELLIVVVIIGILAAIALPKFGSTREAAYYSTLKADLNNLRSAQEIYYTNGQYEYGKKADIEFSESSGSTVTLALSGTGQGYSATAIHAALGDGTDLGCNIFYGDATAPTEPNTPSAAGQIACTD